MTASVSMASSSGVHLEFSFSRLSPKVVDIDGGRRRAAGECDEIGVWVWADS